MRERERRGERKMGERKRKRKNKRKRDILCSPGSEPSVCLFFYIDS